jgi:A/G-specific adenine glycosylase
MNVNLEHQVVTWYHCHRRELPWRQAGAGAWAVMVSEYMLQQTPVSRVLPAYQDWLARWPTASALAAATPADAVRQWGRLGYPRRALRLHEAATIIANWH